MDSQWWSAEQLRNYQRSQLSQLLRHAKKNVPFYEHRLDAVVKPNGDIDWDRWGEIPIVKRSDMIEHRDAMQARELPPGHGPTAVFETSGTTGSAIQVTTSSLGTLASNALRWRCQVWNDLDWGKSLCVRDGTDRTVGGAPYGSRAGPWGPAWNGHARSGHTWIINKLATDEEVLDFLQYRGCSYLATGPKTAHVYALGAQRSGRRLPIEAVLCQGAAVEDVDRTLCAEAFGAKLIEHYSSKEAGQLAHACPVGHLHVNDEAVLLEILDEHDLPCSRGETGRVVVTPIFGTAQPLIRYEQGDLAAFGDRCSCGRQSPVLTSLSGRQIAMFRHPDGRIAVQVLPTRAHHTLDCRALQVAQVGPNQYEIRYVPNEATRPGDEPAFAECFRETFFSDAQLTFRRLKDPPLTPAGKQQQYVVEWTEN
jgi:phenylacetate-CoA ligase